MKKVVITNSLMMVIYLATLVLLIAVTVKVVKMVWKSDKILPLMLFSLSASILGMLFFYAFQIITTATHTDCTEDKTYMCMVNYMTILNEFFLSIAVTLNANKWIYFLMRINTFVRIETLRHALKFQTVESADFMLNKTKS